MVASKKTQKKKALISYLRSVWIFPTIAVVILVVLSILQVSGSSIGAYQNFLYGNQKDSALLFGRPQGVRGDEWLVATQLAIAQKVESYDATNDNYVEPTNLSIITDAPTFEWSTLFKPQNLGYFLLPFEVAFAFKWWLLLFGLVMSAYVFFLRITNKNIVVSIAGSVIIGFAPFVFWWYQSSTIGPLAYGFLIAIMCMSVIDNRRWTFFGRSIKPAYLATFKAFILGYLLTAFAFILYPPFQIPVAIVVAAFVLGYLLNKRSSLSRLDWKRIVLSILTSVVIAGSLCIGFVASHSEEVKIITNTAYPGKREVNSGGYDIRTLLVTYLQPQLQRGSKGPNYIQNQSESSNFIVLPLFFILPALALTIWLIIKKRHIDWILISLLAVCLLFIAHLFIPLPIALTKLTFLHLVPQSRLLIGLGILGVILAIYTAVVIRREIKSKKEIAVLSTAYGILYLIIIIAAGFEIATLYPQFISNKIIIAGLAIIPTAGMVLLLMGRIKTGAVFLALFSIASVFYIHPLYVGLGPIYNSDLTKKIQAISETNSVWAATGDILLENIPQMSNRKAITGVNPYPDTDFWSNYAEDNSIYNRYAHVLLTTNDDAALILTQPDQFVVSGACTRPITKKIDYIISSIPLTYSCDQLVDTISYPARTFYFYKVNHSLTP